MSPHLSIVFCSSCHGSPSDPNNLIPFSRTIPLGISGGPNTSEGRGRGALEKPVGLNTGTRSRRSFDPFQNSSHGSISAHMASRAFRTSSGGRHTWSSRELSHFRCPNPLSPRIEPRSGARKRSDATHKNRSIHRCSSKSHVPAVQRKRFTSPGNQ